MTSARRRTAVARRGVRRACCHLLVAMVFLLGAQVAVGQRCIHEVTVDTTGFGVAGTQGSRAVNAAVLEALALAVTQVRGAFVQVETELVESFQEAFTDGELSITDSSSFSRLIQERVSGLVTRYTVLSSSESAGIVTVNVRATVCNDARLALVWRGPRDGRSAFEGALGSAFANAGWHVVQGELYHHSNPLRISLETGASHVANVFVSSRYAGEYRGLQAYDVTFDVQVQDITGGLVLAGVQRTVNAAARSAGEAESEAAVDVASDLANVILVAVGARRSTAKRLAVAGVRRPNTPIELQRALEEIAGVTGVTVAHRDETVVFNVITARDMCSIANDLADQRRMLIEVEDCSGVTASVRVHRE